MSDNDFREVIDGEENKEPAPLTIIYIQRKQRVQKW